VKFAVENKTLYNFQIKNEKYDDLISLLSRSYPGIFSNYYEVNEKTVAQRLKISRNELKNQLQYVEKQGLIDISWQSELPQVVFLHERLPDDYFRIDKPVYDIRKGVALEKFKKLKKFLTAPTCRSVLLLDYFGQKGEPCGKCDVCLYEKKSDYTMTELIDLIKDILKENSRLYNEMAKELNLKNEKQLSLALNWMVDEGMVQTKDNVFTLS
jgi:ATP-dependent DNA helicase RecQ